MKARRPYRIDPALASSRGRKHSQTSSWRVYPTCRTAKANESWLGIQEAKHKEKGE